MKIISHDPFLEPSHIFYALTLLIEVVLMRDYKYFHRNISIHVLLYIFCCQKNGWMDDVILHPFQQHLSRIRTVGLTADVPF